MITIIHQHRYQSSENDVIKLYALSMCYHKIGLQLAKLPYKRYTVEYFIEEMPWSVGINKIVQITATVKEAT